MVFYEYAQPHRHRISNDTLRKWFVEGEVAHRNGAKEKSMDEYCTIRFRMSLWYAHILKVYFCHSQYCFKNYIMTHPCVRKVQYVRRVVSALVSLTPPWSIDPSTP